MIGITENYAKNLTVTSCQYADDWEDLASTLAGDLAHGAISGGLEAADAAADPDAIIAYRDQAEEISEQQFHDTCTFLVGADPTCGSDPGHTPSGQQCEAGLAVPQPVTGGLIGTTLVNSDSALQETCTTPDAVDPAAAVPGLIDAITQMLATLEDSAGEAENQATVGSMDFVDQVEDATCVYLVGDSSCLGRTTIRVPDLTDAFTIAPSDKDHDGHYTLYGHYWEVGVDETGQPVGGPLTAEPRQYGPLGVGSDVDDQDDTSNPDLLPQSITIRVPDLAQAGQLSFEDMDGDGECSLHGIYWDMTVEKNGGITSLPYATGWSQGDLGVGPDPDDTDPQVTSGAGSATCGP